jgi:hypothetical protein
MGGPAEERPERGLPVLSVELESSLGFKQQWFITRVDWR